MSAASWTQLWGQEPWMSTRTGCGRSHRVPPLLVALGPGAHPHVCPLQPLNLVMVALWDTQTQGWAAWGHRL